MSESFIDNHIDAFNTRNTGMSFYNSMISDTEMVGKSTMKDYYKFEKGMEYHYEYLTCDEYFEFLIKHGIHKKSNIDFYKNSKLTKDYKDLMENGVLFNIPFLNLADKSQEGRHRMCAASQYYGNDKKFPVLIVTPTDIISNEQNRKCMEDYINSNYPNYPDLGRDYIISIIEGSVNRSKEMK